MKCLVTGAGGFIGSHLCDKLLADGHDVIGVDAFIPYYPRALKERNLAGLLSQARFRFHEVDLRQYLPDAVLQDVEVAFHLAAQPGLMRSWSDFEGYWTCNVQSTHKLLEAIGRAGSKVRRLLYISTSSVYGEFASGDENLPTKPTSPYGVTKLAGEALCRAYTESFDLPAVILRYFSVYGPRQRPDMGYYRFIDALQHGQPIVVYGDGRQVRGNTYIDDCVSATIAAIEAPVGEVYNVGGGETASVWDILRRLEVIAERRAVIQQEPARPGDQRYTFADTTKLLRHFGWMPTTNLDEGLARQWEWQKIVDREP